MNEIINEEDIKLAEKQEKLQKSYTLLDIESVVPNSYNPNKLEGVDFQKLKESLERDEGNRKQPIIVRERPTETGKYEIIDGYHRHKAMKELGFEEVVVVINNVSEAEAMLQTISMNKLRGNPDPVLLGSLINILKTEHKMTDKELQDNLGYTDDELKTIESFSDFNFDKYEDNDILEDKEEKLMIEDIKKITLTSEGQMLLNKIMLELNIKDESLACLEALKCLADKLDGGVSKIHTKEDIADSLIPF